LILGGGKISGCERVILIREDIIDHGENIRNLLKEFEGPKRKLILNFSK
jgi:hypoxanthine-guanine phosphoribosyltransferase